LRALVEADKHHVVPVDHGVERGLGKVIHAVIDFDLLHDFLSGECDGRDYKQNKKVHFNN
jgi:hypothetical protein